MSYKWYSRNRLYEYGYYDIKKKKYYNEDSGKWVSRLNKKVIEEKYIRYEFSYWDEREIEKEFGYELVERIGRFLFLLYKTVFTADGGGAMKSRRMEGSYINTKSFVL